MLNTTRRNNEPAKPGTPAHPTLGRLIHNLPGIAYRAEWIGAWNMLFLSEGCRRILGYESSELTPGGRRSWDELIDPADRDRARRQIDAAVLGGSRFEVFYRARSADGVERWLKDQGRLAETGADGRVYLEGFVSDVTLQKQTEDSLRSANRAIDRLTREDPMTGLSNRRDLELQLPRAISFAKRWKQPLGVIMADLDHFKAINDRYGHLAGDQVLIWFSHMLRTSCRMEDIPVRFGGEEFLVLLPNSDTERSTSVANRLRKLLRCEPPPVPGPISASFGVTVMISDDNRDSLIARADRALYVAKHRGRDRIEVLAAQASSTGWGANLSGWPF